MVSLAGKAAVELYHSETCSSGCHEDIRRACNLIRNGLSNNGSHGFGMIEVSNHAFQLPSESMNSRNEAVTQAELERYKIKAKDILLKKRDFLKAAVKALMEKETLLYSDISELRRNVEITEVAV